MPEKEREIEKKLLDMLSSLKEQGISPEQILGIVTKALKVDAKEETKVPISVFNNVRLLFSALITIVLGSSLAASLLFIFNKRPSLFSSKESRSPLLNLFLSPHCLGRDII